jgi:tetratricopeptide (TPR) repeat protein
MDDETKALLIKSRELYERKEFDKADYVLRDLLERGGGFADVFDMLGVIAHSRGDLVAAARYLEKAVALNPSYTDALLNLAVTYNDLGKYDAAKEIQSRARVLSQQNPSQIDPFARGKIANMHADLAQIYVEHGLVGEAIEQYAKAVALCPAFADLRTRLGNLYRDSGDFARAKEQYQAAKDANPKYLPARVLLGVTMYFTGDTPGAIAQWREVLAIDPENKSAQMYVRMAEHHPSLAPANRG